ncbi:MAG: DUF2141 domain-containing protein [Pseudomonadota bacterium]
MTIKRYAIAAAVVLTVAPAGAEDGAASARLFDFDHVSCNGDPNEIRLVIDGLEESVGLVTVDLYVNDDQGFLKRAGRVEQRRAAARAPRTAICVTAPEPGDYAIAVYHDENANKTFDKGAFGLPAEPWGISNNPRVRFGPPHVSEALFPVREDGAKVIIKLN